MSAKGRGQKAEGMLPLGAPAWRILAGSLDQRRHLPVCRLTSHCIRVVFKTYAGPNSDRPIPDLRPLDWLHLQAALEVCGIPLQCNEVDLLDRKPFRQLHRDLDVVSQG